MPSSLIPKAGEIINKPLSPGTKRTSKSRITPPKNARFEYLFVENLSLNIELLPRQLNPWKRRAIVSVENAIVEAKAASPF